MFFRVERKDYSDLFLGVSLAGKSDSLVIDEECKQDTAPRASFTCHTRNFSRVRVAQVLEPSSGQDRWIVVLAILESHSISSMFYRTLLDPQLSPHFSTPFLTLAPRSSTSPSLLCPSMCPSTAPLQGGLCIGRLAEQSPRTIDAVDSQSRRGLIQVDAATVLKDGSTAVHNIATVLFQARLAHQVFHRRLKDREVFQEGKHEVIDTRVHDGFCSIRRRQVIENTV